MKISPKLPNEDLNSPSSKSLKEFTGLLIIFFVIVIPILVLLNFASVLFVKFVPLHIERKAMSLLFLGGDLFNAQEIGPVDKYQRSLLKKLGLNTEKNNSLSVHFSCNDLPNALAFGDRKIIVFKGIYDLIEYENALLFILGHEAGHHFKRHLFKRTVKQIGLSTLFGWILGSSGDQGLNAIMEKTRDFSVIKYGRDDERESDDFAIEKFKNNGISFHKAEEFFEGLMDKEGKGLRWLEVLSTHPASINRVNRIISNYKNGDRPSKKIPQEIKMKINEYCKK